MQAALWGRNSEDWAAVQEATCRVDYEYALSRLRLKPGDRLLDIGCGAGLFCSMAVAAGASVTGFDATEAMVEQARRRVPQITFFVGDMESLPFEDGSFDVVTGFNSFQYGANVPNALGEARRVLKSGGRLVAMIWGNKADCEASSYLAAVGGLLPAPPPGAPGPFALTEKNRLEQLLVECGFKIESSYDVPTVWEYPDMDTALKGLLSAGPVTRAIDHSGWDKVYATVRAAVQPYVRPDGHVVYHNTFRVVMAEAS